MVSNMLKLLTKVYINTNIREIVNKNPNWLLKKCTNFIAIFWVMYKLNRL